jgi:lysophospholipase L1-like esterase
MIRRIFFWLCLPVSALQGLWLRRTALRLPEAEGEKTGVVGQGPLVNLLAMGDSIIAGVGTESIVRSLPAQFANALASQRDCKVQWTVCAGNGADIATLRSWIEEATPNHEVSIILISIGVNDVTGLSSANLWQSQLDKLAIELASKWPQARAGFIGLPPMGKFPLPPQPLRFTLGQRAAELDRIATQVILKYKNMLHIPTDIDPVEQEFCEDGFHPSADACGDWADELVKRFAADSSVS